MLWLCQQRLVIVLMKQPLLLQIGTEECVAECVVEWNPCTERTPAVPCVQAYLLEPSLQHLECT